jgi:hypothetical protein
MKHQEFKETSSGAARSDSHLERSDQNLVGDRMKGHAVDNGLFMITAGLGLLVDRAVSLALSGRHVMTG